MSTNSGTLGRTNRALSLTSNQMKRQRSVEWQQEHNYSSSEEENDRIGRLNSESNAALRKNSYNPTAQRDPSVLAQLIAQTQQLSSGKRCANVRHIYAATT